MVIIEGRGHTAIGTIYGIGRNYAEHAKELGNETPVEEPVVFLKAASSARGLVESPVAHAGKTLHYETELVVRIGRQIAMGQNVADLSDVDAIGLGLDLTDREKQKQLKEKGLPWTLAKSFTGSSILSPMILTKNLEGQTLFEFKFYLEGKLRQQGRTKDMIFSIPHILTFLASSNVLLPGDLIFTGTPAGVGPIKKGQSFRLELCHPLHTWDGVL